MDGQLVFRAGVHADERCNGKGQRWWSLVRGCLDAVLFESVTRQRAEDGVRMSFLLDEYWHHPVATEELQSELDRLVQDPKDLAMLAEIFAALGNDPVRIAECFAHPLLTQRLAPQYFVENERIHGPLRSHVNAQVKSMRSAADFQDLDGGTTCEIYRTR